jgi:hypothetical protein
MILSANNEYLGIQTSNPQILMSPPYAFQLRTCRPSLFVSVLSICACLVVLPLQKAFRPVKPVNGD